MACDCVNLNLVVNLYSIQYELEAGQSGGIAVAPQGNYNNFRWYLFEINGQDFVLWYNNSNDRYVLQSGITPNNGGTIHLEWLNFTDIPIGSISPNQWNQVSGVFTSFSTSFTPQTYNIDLTISGTFGGYNYYQFNIENSTYYLWNNIAGNQWEMGYSLGGVQAWGAVKNSGVNSCPPLTSFPVWILDEGFIDIETKECQTFLLNCLTVCYSTDYSAPKCIDINIYDYNANGSPIFVFQVPELPNLTFQIFYSESGITPYWAGWYLVTLGSQGDFVSFLDNDGTFVNFPQDAPNVFGWLQMNYFPTFGTQVAKECPIIPTDCDCGIEFEFNLNGEIFSNQVEIVGLHNGRNYWSVLFDNQEWLIYWNGIQWVIAPELDADPVDILAKLYKNSLCPIGEPYIISNDEPTALNLWFVTSDPYQDFLLITSKGIDCTSCGREDRYQKEYDSIKLPKVFQEQNRGLKDCCCENIVLASNSSNSWENDKTSMWIKLNIGGTAQFKVLKDDQETNYTPTPKLFINEPNAIYTTINWNDVLNSDGEGCYKLVIEYNISGIIGSLEWGIYKLLPYTIENARGTARLRAFFDGYHEIERINFSGSNVESTHRFYGFIGNRQPNTEIDNLIYSDRQMKRVIRENLNSYEIITDPLNECQILPMVDLFLLSENELFISDYNAHNHSYRYQDLPVIVEDSPEIEYYDFSRKAKLIAKVGDKFKNKRTYF